MIEEVNKMPKTTNWEEIIEHKVSMLFEEILELETELQHIKDRYFEDKLNQ